MIPMYIERVPNRNSPPAVLLRESFRRDGKVCKRTLANLSKWPDEIVRGLRILLKGGVALKSMDDAFEILRSRPHGHVAAVVGTARKLGLERLLDRRPSRMRSLAAAMIAARVLDPRSKLATARGLASETQTDTPGEELGAEDATAEELYEAMDWLLRRQPRIERTLAARHVEDGSLVLCDLTSVYFEGTKCPPAKRGCSRDGRRGKLQIVFALLCDREGRPVAAQVFEGNTADPGSVAARVEKLTGRFSLSRVVVAGDRGMLTDARIREDLGPAGLRWITSLRAPAIRRLASGGDLQLSIFDERDLAEVSAPELCPGERPVVCRNPLLAAERARKREALLAATEVKLEQVVRATQRDNRPLRDEQRIAEESALDGICVIRTNVPAGKMGPEDTVRACKSLSRVERAFRSFKGVDLKVRPVHHRLADRVRAHVFLCMLAYYVEWHMRRAPAPCSSTTTTRPPQKPPAPRPSRPPASPARHAPRRPGSAPPRAFPSTASGPCSATSPPSPATASGPRARSHDRRHPRPPHPAPGRSLPPARRPPISRTR